MRIQEGFGLMGVTPVADESLPIDVISLGSILNLVVDPCVFAANYYHQFAYSANISAHP